MMKYFINLFALFLSFVFVSCGIINSSSGMPSFVGHSIFRIYTVGLDGGNLKFVTNGSDLHLLPNGRIIYIKNDRMYSSNENGSDSLIISPPIYEIYNYELFANNTKALIQQGNSAYILNFNSGEINKLTVPIFFNEIAISSDGKNLALTNDTCLYLINRSDSSIKLLKDTVNNRYYYRIGFTKLSNNLVYIQNTNNGYSIDLRLFDIKQNHDTSLYYNAGANKPGAYTTSLWNNMMFANQSGINLLNLNNYSYTFLHSGRDAHFSYDSTKVTFVNSNGDICIMDLVDNSLNTIHIDLPNNYIKDPILALDEKHVIFQADTSWNTKQ